MQLAQPGANPTQSASRLYRSVDGKMRFDSGNVSVITDPATQQTIMLDHLKKEFRAFPAPQISADQLGPGGLAAAALPSPPANVQDLGKSFIEGLEVEGKRYTFQPPDAPELPGLPQAPGLPKLPQAPQPPATSEVWTSTKLQLPVLTKITGSFGEQTCRCRYAQAGEPSPALFQIPPQYKPAVTPPPPNLRRE